MKSESLRNASWVKIIDFVKTCTFQMCVLHAQNVDGPIQLWCQTNCVALANSSRKSEAKILIIRDNMNKRK